jgi:transcriptional regulator with GAF, ATPase, and Fis domain
MPPARAVAPSAANLRPAAISIDERLRFETLLSDLVTRFMGLAPDRLDGAIQASLEALVRTLGVERCAVAQFADGGRSLLWTHGFASDGAPWPDLKTDMATVMPWYTQQLRERRTLVLPRLPDGVPAEARGELARIAATGLRSLLAVPLEAGGEVLGMLSLLVYSRARDWDRRLVAQVHLLAGVFASELYRRKSEARLGAAEELNRCVLASLSSEVSVLDSAGRLVAGNGAWKRSIRRESPDVALGSNRLEALERAAAAGDRDAAAVRSGILSVLRGERPRFDLQYCYRGHGAERHYLLAVTPLPDGGGAVVAHTDVTELQTARAELERSLREVRELKEQVEAENLFLHQEVRRAQGFEEIVGSSPSLARVLKQVEQVAVTDAPVLLLGETGTGKDLLASALHARSRRRARALVAVNCAALPTALIESELFGHERGAFTGAVQRKAGRFEIADGGTLLLDEIGELPGEVQAKLLRVLQSGEFERLGCPRTQKVDVRVIAATNRDLEQEVREGRFRADLYYRLSVFPITLPPLRQRPEDIPLLVWHFIARHQGSFGKSIKRVPRRVLQALSAYAWPGNVRELQNVVERALILSNGPSLELEPELLGAAIEEHAAAGSGSLEEVERRHVRSVLEACHWRISGPGNAAERLGLKRSTLQFRIKKLGIAKPGTA